MRPLSPVATRGAALIAGWVVASVAHATSPQAALELHGTRLSADCRADNWPSARAAIEQAAAGRDVPQLATLLRTYLCDEGAAAAAWVRRHAPTRILERSEGTGESPSRRRVAAADALTPRGGAVYGLQVARATPDRVALHWQADEACVHSVVLRHQAGAWAFVEAGSACD